MCNAKAKEKLEDNMPRHPSFTAPVSNAWRSVRPCKLMPAHTIKPALIGYYGTSSGISRSLLMSISKYVPN